MQLKGQFALLPGCCRMPWWLHKHNYFIDSCWKEWHLRVLMIRFSYLDHNAPWYKYSCDVSFLVKNKYLVFKFLLSSI
jgi:hypothetical protein